MHGTHSSARIAPAGDTARQFVVEELNKMSWRSPKTPFELNKMSWRSPKTPFRLTESEKEILALLGKGFSYRAITVWIEQTVKRTDYACSCSDRVHRVSASDVQKVIGMGYYQMKNGQRVKELKLPTYVCDCMGHFIE